MSDTLPFLDLSDPQFSTRSEEVHKAREISWCARTPYGLAVLRHRHAGLLLRDRRLRQGSYDWPRKCGLEGSFAEFWMRSVISQEGDAHRTLRLIAQNALSNDYILSLRSSFAESAAALIKPLREQASFEFVERVSEPFAGQAVTTLLALNVDEAPQIAKDASTLGLAMGMHAKSHEADVNAACDRLLELSDRLLERVRIGADTTSFTARMVASADQNEMRDTQALRDLIVISIFGGVDTTRAQLAFAMALFARHPAQWAWLRENPSEIPKAIDEVVRMRPTTTWSTREAVESFEMDGLDICAGDTVHILVHATATDPATGHDNQFDITADRKVHFGFGGGSHHCLGQFVARTDMSEALRILLTHWQEIQLAGTPEYLPDSGNTSPLSMPISPVWA